MSSSSLFFITITLLVFILTVESVYNAYLYDDGNGDEEHCCLVRVRENFCLATPITRSLIQINKQCHRFNRPKHRRFGEKKKNNKYLDKISRRLNVQASQEVGDRILMELKKPLEKHMLENDLICLTSTDNNNLNLEKCYVELVDELDNNMDDDDDDDDDHMLHRGHRRRKHRHRHHRQQFDHKKRAVIKTDAEEDDAIDDGDTKINENEAENEVRRIELDQPVRIREGHGLSIRQIYKLNPSHIRATHRQQRQCWSWYRKQTRKIRHNPSKHEKSCINLNDHREKCINQLIYNTFNNTETNNQEQEQYTPISLSIGSKLYCKNQAGYNKLIGLHHHSTICFHTQDQITIQHKFTDIAGLSDIHKNKDILEFISNNNKLLAEFEDDCHDKTTLVETTESEKKDRPKRQD